jgi:hypothetical protein
MRLSALLCFISSTNCAAGSDPLLQPGEPGLLARSMRVPFVPVQIGACNLKLQHRVVFCASEATVPSRTGSLPVIFASIRLLGADQPKPIQFRFKPLTLGTYGEIGEPHIPPY